MIRKIQVALGVFLGFATTAFASDALIREAADAYRRRDVARVQTIAERVRGHVLEAYPRYWALRLQLPLVPAAQIEAFSSDFFETPLANQLRLEWLNEQSKVDNWAAWTDAALAVQTDNQEFECNRATWLLRQGKTPDKPPKDLWAERLTDACAIAFAAYARAGKISTDDVILRFRLSADGATHFAAKEIASVLPDALRPDEQSLTMAHHTPQRLLAPKQNASVPKEAALYALTRWARQDMESADEAWKAVRASFGKQEQSWAALQLGVFAAKQHHYDAIKWFANVADIRVVDAQAAWWVRAALRAGNWSEVLRATATMSETARSDPTWAYWRARALAATGKRDDAQVAFAAIKDGFNFYNWLAAEELGLAPQVAGDAPAATPEQLERFDKSARAQRAVALARLNLRQESAREWYWVTRDLSDADAGAASAWMQKQEIWDRAIGAAERTKSAHNLMQRYVVPFRDALFASARDEGLEPTLVAALARQESRFAPNVVSSAGAVGLMQLMPNTAKWVAKRLGRPYTRDALEDPVTNAQFGSFYLRTVMDGLAKSPVLALAAYNAGPGRAKNWQAGTPLEGAIYAESILFNETRDYVKKVLVNAMWIDRLHMGGKGPSLKARLGTVPAAGQLVSLAKDTP